MNRRELLKLLAMGVVGHTLDVDRLLWVPGEKTIFLPPVTGLTLSQVIAVEMERVIPRIRELFERDDIFYSRLSK